MSAQLRVYNAMHGDGVQGLTPFQRVLVVLIFFSVFIAVLTTEPTIRAWAGNGTLVVELTLGAIFLLEYGCRIWSAGARPEFQGLRGRFRYAAQPLAIIDALAILPFLFGPLGAESLLLRLIRLMRLLALSKLVRYSAALRLILQSLSERRFELAFTVTLAGIVILLSSAALYVVEGDGQPEAFGSIPRAAWWSVATLTTVGYGDLVPATPLGKFFAAMTAFAGIGLIAMPTGILAAGFSDAFARARSDTSVSSIESRSRE